MTVEGADFMGNVEQISDRITKMLLHEIQAGEFSESDSLPPEVELAERFGVSRNIVRECLARLEREGWVTRKHGVGTLINKIVAQVSTRLDLNYELSQTLELSGKRAGTSLGVSQTVGAGRELAEYLKIAEGDPVLRVPRTISADGKPAIFCVDYIAEKLIQNHSYTQADLEPPIFQFLERFCGAAVETNLAELRAMPLTEEAAGALNLPLTCALLFLGEVGFDLRSNPILYSEEYFIDRVIRHMIVRKKI